jgi:glyoxylase-like metal-dependent hydrolase (beta-lactamase superfamily II)/8-oxo-dGTP pyrophosphatase MutT (NUDIX family)
MCANQAGAIRPAATMVVARPAEDGIEVLMVRRGRPNRFVPGFVVFPGGVVEPGDRDLAVRLFGRGDEEARACALRELYEETGFLLTARGFRVRAAPRPAIRVVDFPHPLPGTLVEIARWVGPEELAVRFEAVFFAVAATAGIEPSPDGVEADRAWWSRPDDVLARRDDDPLMWPTMATLEALSACRSVEDVLALRIPQAPRPDSVPPPPEPGLAADQRQEEPVPIVRVLAPNPGPFTLEGTNTWIVGRAPSVVIDPGPDDPRHIDAVLADAAPIGAIVLTHHHSDHAPGAARLAKAGGSPVFAYRPSVRQHPLAHGQVVEAGAVRLTARHTPGHTPDHVAFLLPSEGALFTGDAVLGRGTTVIDPPEGDMSAYIRSLREMRELEPRRIYPGHGPVVFEAMDKLDEYLAHRARREEQILAALAQGMRTPAEMVPGLYGDEVPESMLPVAARSVLAHLIKLERQGRVVRIGRYADERFVAVQPRECIRCGRPAAPGSRLCRRCALAELQERPERPER